MNSALEPAFYVHSICYCYSSLFWIFESVTWSIFVGLPSLLLFLLSKVLPFKLFLTTALRNYLRTVQKNKLSRIWEVFFAGCFPRAQSCCLCTTRWILILLWNTQCLGCGKVRAFQAIAALFSVTHRLLKQFIFYFYA